MSDVIENKTPEIDKLLDAKAVCAALGIGESTLWAGCKTGRWPAPIKLGTRMTRWKSSAIAELINKAK